MKSKAAKLKIKTVTYSKLSNLGNYENERIEVTCEVDGRDPAAVLVEAKRWVTHQLNCSCGCECVTK